MRNIVLGAMALGLLTACAPQQRPELTQEQLVARGEYLVNNVAGCNDCHTPMTPQGPDMARALQGAELGFAPTAPMPWAPVAPPLAAIPAHFTQDQFAAFLQTGLRPDGSRPLPPMPPYRLNEEDARAITAYIATLPAANQATPPTSE